MDGSHAFAVFVSNIVDRCLDVLGRGSQRHEDRVGPLRVVFTDQPVVSTGQLAKLPVSFLEHFEDGLIEVVASGDDAVHVVFLVLHRTDQCRVFQIDH